MKEMDKFIKELSSIDMSLLTNYEYKYYTRAIINGKETIMESVENNNTYGHTREGYDKFREVRGCEVGVGYADVTSLRPIEDSKTKEVIGFITETRLNNPSFSQESTIIKEKAIEHAKEVLKVEDVESFEYYLLENGPQGYLGNEAAIETRNYINFLGGILKQYNTEEEFKSFFDKIIKGAK